MFWGGLFALVALTNMGFYPRSQIRVPGERFSNMGPPTLTIVALTFLQIGLVLLIRPWVLERLEHDARWKRSFGWINENSLPLYLFHSTGFAIALTLVLLITDYLPADESNAEWWLTRPLWLIAPAIATWPILTAGAGDWRVARPPRSGSSRQADRYPSETDADGSSGAVGLGNCGTAGRFVRPCRPVMLEGYRGSDKGGPP